MRSDATVRVREAVHSDLASLIRLDGNRAGDADRQRFLADRLAAEQLLVAEHNGRVVGYVIQDCSFFERGFVHLLYVEETRRRQGLGGLLLAASVRHCATSRVFTSTNVSNAGMHALLARHGWTRAGMVDGLDEGDPEVFYFIDADRGAPTRG